MLGHAQGEKWAKCMFLIGMLYSYRVVPLRYRTDNSMKKWTIHEKLMIQGRLFTPYVPIQCL